MGTCMSESQAREEDLQTRYLPRTQASHMAVNPVGMVIQYGISHVALQENDPLTSAERLMDVEFKDNGLEPVDKAVNWEKAEMIGKNAKLKVQAQAEPEVEVAFSFE